MIRPRNFVFTASVMASALVFAGCANSDATNTDQNATESGDDGAAAVAFDTIEELVEAAEQEGSVRLYTSLLEPDLVALVEGFESTYDIEIEAIRLGGADAMNRFDSESAASASTADILVVNDTAYFASATERNIVTPLQDLGVLELVPDFPQELVLEEEGTAVLTVTNSGLVYNTDLVSADEVPTTWDELLDERWSDRILSVDPAASLANVLTWEVVSQEQGPDYLEALGHQLARKYPNLVPMHEALAAGEGDLAVPSPEFYVAAQAVQGHPLAFQALSPMYYPAQAMGVATDAQHPAAARLLVHYLLTEDGAATITGGQGVFSPYDQDIPEDFWVPSVEEIEDVQSRQDDILKGL